MQMSSNNSFGQIPVDQAIEVTVNKDTQTPGGIVGFSLKPAAIKWHYITAKHRSAFLQLLRYVMHCKNSIFITRTTTAMDKKG